MRRTLLIVFLFFLSGLLIYYKLSVFLIGAVTTALFLIFYIKKLRSLCIYCFVFVLIGIATANIHRITFDKRYERLTKLNTFQGYIIDKENGSYTLRNYKENYKIIFFINKSNSLKPGDYIKFDGKVSEKQDYKKASLNSRWIDAYAVCNENTVKISRIRNLLLIPSILKYKINSAILEISKTGGGFVCGLVSGYTGDINANDMTEFKELGISHILAVSGFNLGIIYYFLSVITGKLHAGLRYIIIILLCFIYTSFAGFDPSISRAFIMVFISILAKMLERPYDTLNGIILTAFIMLIMNSYNIFNIGFILSFAATLGIILLKEDINDRLPLFIRFFRNELSVSLAAFIITLPFILWFIGGFSVFSILINIIISPIISFLTVLSFFASIVFIITGIGIFFYPSVLIGELVIRLIRLASPINISIYSGKPSVVFIILYFLLLLKYLGYIKFNIAGNKSRIIEYGLIIALFFSLYYHKPLLKIHILNVGQGDSILIETPERHSILIDTGPELFNHISTRDKIIPYLKRLGYNKLDMIIISHPHKDHAGGLKYLMENFEVGNILVYEKPDTVNGSCAFVSKGDYIHVEDVIINILAPENNLPTNSSENETCLIMELKYKNFTMLFTGDAPKEDLDYISGEYDILKVPHHGSILSLSIEMLDNTIIGNAVISVGKNSFGHPSSVVIEELIKRNIGVYRTDKMGDIIIQTQGNQYSILSQ